MTTFVIKAQGIGLVNKRYTTKSTTVCFLACTSSSTPRCTQSHITWHSLCSKGRIGCIVYLDCITFFTTSRCLLLPYICGALKSQYITCISYYIRHRPFFGLLIHLLGFAIACPRLTSCPTTFKVAIRHLRSRGRSLRPRRASHSQQRERQKLFFHCFVLR